MAKVTGSWKTGIIKVPEPPKPAAREWDSHPRGRIGWSWESRDWLSEPSDGRPAKSGFVSRGDAFSYLEGS